MEILRDALVEVRHLDVDLVASLHLQLSVSHLGGDGELLLLRVEPGTAACWEGDNGNTRQPLPDSVS